jgi:hypothetical protein
LPDEGSVKANGTARISPLEVDLDLKIANVILNRFQPYVGRTVRIDVDAGAAAADGHLNVHTAEDGAAVVAYTGAASVKDLVVNDTTRDEELVKWSSLALNQVAYQSRPATLQVAEVVLDQPYARILIDKAGKLNVSGLAIEPEPNAAPQQPGVTEEAPEGAMAVTIDTLTIRDGLTNFADYSIKPSLDTGIYNLNGQIDGLSSIPSEVEGEARRQSRQTRTGESHRRDQPIQSSDSNRRAGEVREPQSHRVHAVLGSFCRLQDQEGEGFGRAAVQDRGGQAGCREQRCSGQTDARRKGAWARCDRPSGQARRGPAQGPQWSDQSRSPGER